MIDLSPVRLDFQEGPKLLPEPPIPCMGRWTHTTDGSDFDCDYEHGGDVTCDGCIINGGRLDPRTGKRYRKARK